jgi:hypothetical protein
VFRDDLSIRQEYEELAQVDLVPGTFYLPSLPGQLEADFVEEFRFGPFQVVAEPLARGKFIGSESGACIQYAFEQPFRAGERMITIRVWPYALSFCDTVTRMVVDPDSPSRPFTMYGEMEGEDLQFSSCTYESLPLWYIDLQFAKGGHALFCQRYREPFFGSGPANLVKGEVWLPEGEAHQDRYWSLVYSAYRHNLQEKFWTVFDRPIGDAWGLAVHEILDATARRYSAELLDERLLGLQELKVTSYGKHGGVVINEFMAANQSAHRDEHGDYDPWIELHNMTDRAIDMGLWSLTNTYEYPYPWQFPVETELPPGGFLVVWADGEPEEGPLHAAFRLSEEGGIIGLRGSWPNNLWVTYGAQTMDTSMGRIPDGTGEIVILESSSPGWSNDPIPEPTPTPTPSRIRGHWIVR